MKIAYYDINRNAEFEASLGATYATVPELLRNSDYVSVHVPLLPTTRHLISTKEFATMKKTAYLINTSRGPVIDEKALAAALKKRQIAGAALDVFENEPKLTPGLAKLDNIVLTPHTASATIATRSVMSEIAAQNILDAMARQKPRNTVNPEIYS
jgi:lactate dehydrogenase-like 2-hydroxyacid dehydrogenase